MAYRQDVEAIAEEHARGLGFCRYRGQPIDEFFTITAIAKERESLARPTPHAASGA